MWSWKYEDCSEEFIGSIFINSNKFGFQKYHCDPGRSRCNLEVGGAPVKWSPSVCCSAKSVWGTSPTDSQKFRSFQATSGVCALARKPWKDLYVPPLPAPYTALRVADVIGPYDN
eukprot:EG_transcript_26174